MACILHQILDQNNPQRLARQAFSGAHRINLRQKDDYPNTKRQRFSNGRFREYSQKILGKSDSIARRSWVSSFSLFRPDQLAPPGGAECKYPATLICESVAGSGCECAATPMRMCGNTHANMQHGAAVQ